ncbi:hypothetical protein ACP4OV_004856 [Aristida adscensionis]
MEGMMKLRAIVVMASSTATAKLCEKEELSKHEVTRIRRLLLPGAYTWTFHA